MRKFLAFIATIFSLPFTIWFVFKGLDIQSDVTKDATAVYTFSTYMWTAMLVTGFPLYLYFKSREWTGILPMLFAGALGGILTALFFPFIAGVASGKFESFLVNLREIFLQPMVFAAVTLIGMITMTIAWLIARPDRTPPVRASEKSFSG